MEPKPKPGPLRGRPESKGLLAAATVILIVLAWVMFGLADRRRPRHADFIAPPPLDPEPPTRGHDWGVQIAPGVDAKIVITDSDRDDAAKKQRREPEEEGLTTKAQRSQRKNQ